MADTMDVPTLQDVRKNHPEYDDLTDSEVTKGLYGQFGSEGEDFDSFSQQVGYDPNQDSGLSPMEQRQRQRNLESMSDAERGLKGGWEKTKGLGAAGVGLLGHAAEETIGVGESLRDWGLDTYQEQMKEARTKYPQKTGFFDISGPGDAIDWAQYTLGDLAPTIASSLISGGVGGLAAGGVRAAGQTALKKTLGEGAERMAKEFGEKLVKRKVAKEGFGKEAAQKAVEKGIGASAGVVASSSLLEGGGMYGEAAEKLGRENVDPFKHGIMGMAAGTVELAGGNIRVLKKLFGQQAGEGVEAAVELAKRNSGARGAAMKYMSDMLREGAKQAPAEFGQEATQEILQMTSVNWDDPEVNEVLTKENAMQVIEAGAAGALAGGAMGGVGGTTVDRAKSAMKGGTGQGAIDSEVSELQQRIERQKNLKQQGTVPNIDEKIKENEQRLEQLTQAKNQAEGKVSYKEAAQKLDQEVPQQDKKGKTKKTTTKAMRKMVKNEKVIGDEFGVDQKSLDQYVQKQQQKTQQQTGQQQKPGNVFAQAPSKDQKQSKQQGQQQGQQQKPGNVFAQAPSEDNVRQQSDQLPTSGEEGADALGQMDDLKFSTTQDGDAINRGIQGIKKADKQDEQTAKTNIKSSIEKAWQESSGETTLDDFSSKFAKMTEATRRYTPDDTSENTKKDFEITVNALSEWTEQKKAEMEPDAYKVSTDISKMPEEMGTLEALAGENVEEEIQTAQKNIETEPDRGGRDKNLPTRVAMSLDFAMQAKDENGKPLTEDVIPRVLDVHPSDARELMRREKDRIIRDYGTWDKNLVKSMVKEKIANRPTEEKQQAIKDSIQHMSGIVRSYKEMQKPDKTADEHKKIRQDTKELLDRIDRDREQAMQAAEDIETGLDRELAEYGGQPIQKTKQHLDLREQKRKLDTQIKNFEDIKEELNKLPNQQAKEDTALREKTSKIDAAKQNVENVKGKLREQDKERKSGKLSLEERADRKLKNLQAKRAFLEFATQKQDFHEGNVLPLSDVVMKPKDSIKKKNDQQRKEKGKSFDGAAKSAADVFARRMIDLGMDFARVDNDPEGRILRNSEGYPVLQQKDSKYIEQKNSERVRDEVKRELIGYTDNKGNEIKKDIIGIDEFQYVVGAPEYFGAMTHQYIDKKAIAQNRVHPFYQNIINNVAKKAQDVSRRVEQVTDQNEKNRIIKQDLFDEAQGENRIADFYAEGQNENNHFTMNIGVMSTLYKNDRQAYNTYFKALKNEVNPVYARRIASEARTMDVDLSRDITPLNPNRNTYKQKKHREQLKEEGKIKAVHQSDYGLDLRSRESERYKEVLNSFKRNPIFSGGLQKQGGKYVSEQTMQGLAKGISKTQVNKVFTNNMNEAQKVLSQSSEPADVSGRLSPDIAQRIHDASEFVREKNREKQNEVQRKADEDLNYLLSDEVQQELDPYDTSKPLSDKTRNTVEDRLSWIFNKYGIRLQTKPHTVEAGHGTLTPDRKRKSRQSNKQEKNPGSVDYKMYDGDLVEIEQDPDTYKVVDFVSAEEMEEEHSKRGMEVGEVQGYVQLKNITNPTYDKNNKPIPTYIPMGEEVIKLPRHDHLLFMGPKGQENPEMYGFYRDALNEYYTEKMGQTFEKQKKNLDEFFQTDIPEDQRSEYFFDSSMLTEETLTQYVEDSEGNNYLRFWPNSKGAYYEDYLVTDETETFGPQGMRRASVKDLMRPVVYSESVMQSDMGFKSSLGEVDEHSLQEIAVNKLTNSEGETEAPLTGVTSQDEYAQSYEAQENKAMQIINFADAFGDKPSEEGMLSQISQEQKEHGFRSIGDNVREIANTLPPEQGKHMRDVANTFEWIATAEQRQREGDANQVNKEMQQAEILASIKNHLYEDQQTQTKSIFDRQGKEKAVEYAINKSIENKLPDGAFKKKLRQLEKEGKQADYKEMLQKVFKKTLPKQIGAGAYQTIDHNQFDAALFDMMLDEELDSEDKRILLDYLGAQEQQINVQQSKDETFTTQDETTQKQAKAELNKNRIYEQLRQNIQNANTIGDIVSEDMFYYRGTHDFGGDAELTFNDAKTHPVVHALFDTEFVDQNGKTIADKKGVNFKIKAPEYADSQVNLSMNFEYGKNNNPNKRSDVSADNTFDAIVNEERTATSRSNKSLEKVEKGDIVKFTRGEDTVYVKVTDKRPVSSITPQEFSRLEGYAEKEVKQNWNTGKDFAGKYTQIVFEKMNQKQKPVQKYKTDSETISVSPAELPNYFMDKNGDTNPQVVGFQLHDDTFDISNKKEELREGEVAPQQHRYILPRSKVDWSEVTQRKAGRGDEVMIGGQWYELMEDDTALPDLDDGLVRAGLKQTHEDKKTGEKQSKRFHASHPLSTQHSIQSPDEAQNTLKDRRQLDLNTVSKQLNNVAKKLAYGTNKIHIHENADAGTVHPDLHAQLMRQGVVDLVKGAYDPKDQSVHIFLDKHADKNGDVDVGAAIKTLMHESALHNGLGPVLDSLGMERKDFLKQVFNKYGKDVIRAEIGHDSAIEGENQFYNDIEEFIARKVERAEFDQKSGKFVNPEINTWVDKIGAMLTKAARKFANAIGKNVEITRSEIREIIAKTYKGLDTKRAIGVEHLIPQDMKPSKHIPYYKDFAEYEESLMSKVMRKTEDNFRPVREMQKALKKQGKKIPDWMNVEQKQRLFAGKTEDKTNRFEEMFEEPIKDELKKHKLTLEDLAKYLWAEHVPKRNKRILDNRIKIENERGYEFTQEELDAPCGISDETAKQWSEELKKSGKDKKLKKAAQMVWNANDFFLDMQRFYGFKSNNQIAKMRKAYGGRFIPMGNDEQSLTDMPAGRGSISMVKGLKPNTEAGVDPVTLTMHRNKKGIINGEKNEVKKSLYKLARNHPNPDLFEIYLPEDELDEHRRTMEETEFEKWVNNNGIFSETELDRIEGQRQNPEVIPIRRDDGSRAYMKIKHSGIDRAVRQTGVVRGNKLVRGIGEVSKWLVMSNTMLNPEFIYSNLFRDTGNATGNIVNMKTRMGEGVDTKKAARDVAKSLPQIMKGIYNYHFRKEGEQMNEMAKWYDDYAKHGGKIGRPFLGNMTELAESMRAEIGKATGGGLMSATRRNKDKILDFATKFNEIFENANRVAAYKYAVENGVSKEQAAKMGRELTVDFNRKGEWGQMLNTFYLFSNAGIGGSARILRGMKNNPKRAGKVAGSIVTGAFSLAMMNRLASGEDEDGINYYDKISNDVKERHMVFMVPGSDGDYLKVPLPYGFGFFYNLGEQMADHAHKATLGRQDTSAAKAAGGIVGSLTHNFNPLSAAGDLQTAHGWLQTISPTLAQPAVDVGMEKTPFGSPLMPTPNYKGQPDAQRHWDSVSEPSKQIAQWINSITGGSKVESGAVDMSPETFDYMLDQFGGGFGRFFFNKLPGIVNKNLSGEKWTWNDVPMLRRVVGKPFEWQNRTIFNESVNEVQAATDRLRESRQAVDQAKTPEAKQYGNEVLQDFVKENRPLLNLDEYRKDTYAKVKQIDQEKEKIHNAGYSEKKKNNLLQQLNDRQQKLMQNFNKKVFDAKEKM